MAYFENLSGELQVVDSSGEQEIYGEELSFGDEVPVGWTVVTGNNDSVELSMEPSGTIVKIAENTNFSVDGLQNLGGAEENSFSLGLGKFRFVAGNASGQEKYKFTGQLTVCGVRGTDGGMESIPSETGEILEEAFCLSGEFLLTLLNTGEQVVVNAGEYASAAAERFESLTMPAEKLESLQNELSFKKLEVSGVPQAPPLKSEPVAAPPPPAQIEESAEAEPPSEPEVGILSKLFGGILGMEVGALTIGDETYARAVFTPTFSFGKLRMSLYLPFIYQTNLFDSDDWYKPRGNNEWSFGTDQDGDAVDIIRDIATDLALKIKYIQWGEQRDPFFFKIGNLNNITIGHGLIMKNYANDLEFPAIRRLGVNIGVDRTKFGFEGMVSDATEPEIFGGRIYLRPAAPAFPLTIGLSGILDIDPAGDLPDAIFGDTAESASDIIGSPILIETGLDLEYPFIESDIFSLIMFGDAAALLPYFRGSGTDEFETLEQGLAWDTVVGTDPFEVRSLGAATGFLGNVGPVDWRLELRYSRGIFLPYLFDGIYDKLRGAYAVNLAYYAMDPGAPDYDKSTLGIYGEAAATVGKIFTFEAGYMWPFSISDDGIKAEDRDYLHTGLSISKIPVINVGASIAYDRYYFVSLLKGEKKSNPDGTESRLRLFDENTMMTTRVLYGITPNIDLSLLLTTSLERDPEGNIIYDGLNPNIVTTVSLQTEVHF